MIKENEKAPEFSLPDKDGAMHSLSEFKGKKVVLYFYPKDNTSGCTQQGLTYKEFYEEYQNENAVIIGISKDSPASHAKFISKYEFPFLLLSDEEGKVLEAYGVWQEKSMYGKKYFGIVRSSVVIDENGVIKAVNYKVKPKEDALCNLNFIK